MQQGTIIRESSSISIFGTVEVMPHKVSLKIDSHDRNLEACDYGPLALFKAWCTLYIMTAGAFGSVFTETIASTEEDFNFTRASMRSDADSCRKYISNKYVVLSK